MKLDLDVKNIFMKSKSWRMKQDELISYNFTENIPAGLMNVYDLWVANPSQTRRGRARSLISR